MGTAKKKPSSKKAFKKHNHGAVDLVVPSGEVCRARRPGMEAFLKTGKIPNSLMPIIQEAIDKGGKMKPEDINLKEFASDPTRISDMFVFMDEMVMAAVIEPKILPIPADEAERDEEELYVDELDQTDKSFLFQWAVGGSADLERFRKELAETLGDLAQSEETGVSA